MSAAKRSRRWSGFRSVLCPVDFSAPSRLALLHAAAVALRGKAALTVAYANDPLLTAAAAAALHDRGLARRSARELRAFVEAALGAETVAELRVKTAASVGDPRDEIFKAARRQRADLIVVGTHGLTGADRLLMGSTTLGILERTNVPVLAVPDAVEHSEHRPAADWPGAPIVAAIDLESRADRDVGVAAAIAQWLGSSLLLLHVVRPIAAPAWVAANLGAHDRTRVADAERRLDTLAKVVRRHVPTSTRVVSGRIAEEIAALVAAERVGLVLTALRDKQGWLGSRRGAISYDILTHAVTPVLAYPPSFDPR